MHDYLNFKPGFFDHASIVIVFARNVSQKNFPWDQNMLFCKKVLNFDKDPDKLRQK